MIFEAAYFNDSSVPWSEQGSKLPCRQIFSPTIFLADDISVDQSNPMALQPDSDI